MKKKININWNIFMIVGFVILVVYSISFITPLFWVFNSAIRKELSFLDNPFAIVNGDTFTLDYIKVALDYLKVPVMIDGTQYYI